MKLRFFLSSSKEQLSITRALEQYLISEGFEPKSWAHDVHEASKYNLESLVNQAKQSDFAIFIFAPDDTVTIRNQSFNIVRDNVLFELGLFTGMLGRNRCYILEILESEEKPMRLPSDLGGITTLKYLPDDPQKTLESIAKSIAGFATKTAKAVLSDFSPNDLKLLQVCEAPSMPSNQAYRAFGSAPSTWDDKPHVEGAEPKAL
jgi:predicted nucleotide-binding protein